MKEPQGFNQRKHIRVNIQLDMRMVLVDAKAAGLLEGKERVRLRQGVITDLSLAGIRVETEGLAPALHFHLLSGAIGIAIKFNLPNNSEPVSALTKAVRVITAGDAPKMVLGLSFTEISPSCRQALVDFIQSH